MKSYQEKLNFAESSDDDKNDGHTEEDPDYIDQEINRTTLPDSATLLGLSPVKAVGKRDRTGYGKQKVKKIKKSVVGLVASACDIDENELLYHDSPECSKCSDLDRLTELLKEKLKMSSTQEKVKILTLAPESWSISKTCNEFDVSEYLVMKARKLKNSKGILVEPEKNKGNVLSDETKLKVLEIFESDEFSRMCPGKKDCVSIKINAKKIKKQKRLLLVRLKELYIEFKKCNPQLKIGFTKFCELRPRFCITAASKGSHTV